MVDNGDMTAAAMLFARDGVNQYTTLVHGHWDLSPVSPNEVFVPGLLEAHTLTPKFCQLR